MAVTSPQLAAPSRPRGVTAVVVLSIVQGVLLLLVGTALVVVHGESEVQSELEASAAATLTLGIVFCVLGLGEGILAVWLAKGSDAVRSVFGIVNTLHVALETYALVALRDLQVATIWSLSLPILVLWLLYGSPAAQEYFDR